MRAITKPGAADGLDQNLLSVLRRVWLNVGIHFGEIFPQFRRLFLPPLIGEPWGFDGTDADGFVLQHAASQRAFNDGLLVGGRSFLGDHPKPAIRDHLKTGQ